MNGATPERDESELLASQLNEAAVVAETEFDAQATLDDVQSRNPHCAVVALLPREGCEQPVGVTTSPAGLEVPPASVKLLNAAFFPAEHGEEVIRLCGRELRVIERVEEGAHFLLVLSSGESSGGFAEYTQRGILLVLYDAGMTAAIARQLAVGLQEYVTGAEISTRKFLARGSTPRPGSRAAPLSLGRHHKPFGSVRIARSLHGLDLVGASPRPAPLDPRSQRQQDSRLRWAIDTRLASGACSEAPERARLHMGLAQRRPCGLGRHVPPVGTEPAAGSAVAASETGFSPSRDIGTQRRCPTHSGERPKRHGHARLARRSTLSRVVAGYHPPTRTHVSHQRATLKPSALGESGWAS